MTLTINCLSVDGPLK